MKKSLLPLVGQAVFLSIVAFSVLPLHFINQTNRQIWDGGAFWMFGLALALLLGALFAALTRKKQENPEFRKAAGFVFAFLGFAAVLGLIFSVHPLWMLVLLVLCFASYLSLCHLYRRSYSLKENLLALVFAIAAAGLSFLGMFIANRMGIHEIWAVRAAFILAALGWLLYTLPVLANENKKADKAGKHPKENPSQAFLPAFLQDALKLIALGGTVFAFSMSLSQTHIFLILLTGLAGAFLAMTLAYVLEKSQMRLGIVLCILSVAVGLFAGIWQSPARNALLQEGRNVIDDFVQDEDISFVTAARLKSALKNALSGDKPQDAYTAKLFYLMENKTLTITQAVSLNDQMTAALGNENLINDFFNARRISLALMFVCALLGGFGLGSLYTARRNTSEAKMPCLGRIWSVQAMSFIVLGLWPILGFGLAAVFLILALVFTQNNQKAHS